MYQAPVDAIWKDLGLAWRLAEEVDRGRVIRGRSSCRTASLHRTLGAQASANCTTRASASAQAP
jgi:hypothetical protein